MTDNKLLPIRFTKITGQEMRDHWGPILDRIEDEMEASRDLRDRIEAQAAEIERLQEALQHCVMAIAEWEKKPEGISPFLLGAMDNARAALGETLHVPETCKENGETFT